MKVRIGIGLGGVAGTTLEEVVDELARLGFDSIWLPEILTAPGYDPLAALAFLAGRRPGTKLGTTMLLPGRNLVRLAKQLATVDRLSGGNLLVTFVPGLAHGPERDAVGVDVAVRSTAIEEALPVVRRLLSGETVSHDGAAGSFTDVAVSPLPAQQPLDLWLGGTAPRSLELCGRLGDGWLPARCTPRTAEAGRGVIDKAAERARRTISPEHFGVSIAYARRPLDELDPRVLRAPAHGPSPAELIPVGLEALRERVLAFIGVGFSKFVVRPIEPVTSWPGELGELADALLDLQS